VCDASATTFLLTHWARDRATQGDNSRLPLQQAVHLLSARNADYLGLADRGRITVGQRADLNLIDPARLSVGTPRLVRDLPAGGKRFLQVGQGYIGTWVAGRCVQREGEVTDQRPGRLVRLGAAGR
jgi:N-acyl-D-aspartate/D-glutamate deacylase